ncbi:MAG TPA: DoxX family protein [Verrucomicrobiae bacterium]
MFKKLFVPSEDSDLTHMALLVARLWFGLTMLFNHGLEKLTHFNEMVGTFPDPLRVGQEASLVLVVFAEVIGALLLAVGFMTRVAAAVLVIDMFVAFLMVHRAGMNEQSGGELAFLYLAGYVVLCIAGGGLFSLDTLAFKTEGRSRLQTRS